jgi:5-oxoprolinase (ATP-hydrolysing) subunit B
MVLKQCHGASWGGAVVTNDSGPKEIGPRIRSSAMVPDPVSDAAAYPRLRWCGDAALTIEFGEIIAPELNRRVLDLERKLAGQKRPGIVETVPTYRSLLVQFDPVQLDPVALGDDLLRLAASTDAPCSPGRLWRVPVAYGGAFGIDLDALAQRHQLSPDEVVARHTGAVYRVYMIGFMPGFTYLGGLDPALATPRQTEPRPVTPAGSIAIGGSQTAIASVEAPSAWHLIGRTPACLFAARREPPMLFAAGDEVQFQPIDARRFEALEHAAAAGELVAEVLRPAAPEPSR